jgi:hypothetical protein
MTEIRFEPNPDATRLLASGDGMRDAMSRVAAEIVDDMERRAPAMVRNNARFFTTTDRDSDGWAGLAAVKSPFWHWAEFGTAGRHFRSPQPFIRPAAQATISRKGGRWRPN